MQIAVGIVLLFFLNFSEISLQLSSDLEGRFLFQLNNGCKSVDIRFDVNYFEVLEKCKSVHGYLRISDLVINSDRKSFPDLQEITGYLLVDNVTGVASIGEIFPNLTAIRGEMLYHEYAIVITNNVDLERVGLRSLEYTTNGALALIQNNPKLCSQQRSNERCIKGECRNCCNSEVSTYDSICTEKCKVYGCNECNNFLLMNEKGASCVESEPLTFELEKKYLINAETCDRFERIKLDERCIRKEECPLAEKHFFNETTQVCEFYPQFIEHCSILIQSIEDVENFGKVCNCTSCHISEIFKISGLSESKNINIPELIEATFSNVTEIKHCLIVSNSSAVINLHFFKHLRKIRGETHTDCYRNGSFYSVIIENNLNLYTLFSRRFEVLLKQGGIYLNNNPSLCSYEIQRSKNAIKTYKKKSLDSISEEGCKFNKINFRIIAKARLALIFTDLIMLKNNLHYEVIYWTTDLSRKVRIRNSYFELTNLEPSTNYGFLLQISHLNGEILLTNYNYFTTLRTDDFIENLHLKSSGLSHILLSWNSTRNTNSFHTEDFIYYLQYNRASLDYCNKTSYPTPNDTGLVTSHWAKNTRPFHQYFLKNPVTKKDFNETLLTAINFNVKNHNITNLNHSTCYFIEIFPCRKRNILLCYMSAVIIAKTDKPLVPSDYNFIILIGAVCLIAVALPTTIVVQYTISLYKLRVQIQNPNKSLADEFELIDKWEIERERIVQVKFLGNGEFGRVFEGYIKPFDSEPVAIKTLVHCSESFEENFRNEAQSMRKINAHHVVKLRNYVLETIPLLVVMELMKHGDLKKFLQRNRPTVPQNNVPQNSGSGYIVATTAPLHQIRPVHEMAVEISDGMAYLESINFIHCDLAARNCMVHENYTIKIGDFGMARDLYQNDYYMPNSRNKKIPLRWMAPEALGNDYVLPRFTTKSDVFSFGIVLFELVTFCEKPYSDFVDEEVICRIRTGRIMERPENCDEIIYELMLKCWKYNPEERITFREIVEYILEHFEVPKQFKRVSFYHNPKKSS